MSGVVPSKTGLLSLVGGTMWLVPCTSGQFCRRAQDVEASSTRDDRRYYASDAVSSADDPERSYNASNAPRQTDPILVTQEFSWRLSF